MTIKAKCEVVAARTDGGEEVRFYVDGECVKTVQHEPKSKEHGSFKEGEEYDVEPDEKWAYAPGAEDRAPHGVRNAGSSPKELLDR